MFEIVNKNGTRIDELGELTQSDGARFNKLCEIDQWFSSLRQTSEHYHDQNNLEWYERVDIFAVEYAKVGFDKWYWRRTVNGWACQAYENDDGWVLNEDLTSPAE